jgi:hypothetical protein
MWYAEFQAYTENGELPQSLKEKFNKKAPDWDFSMMMDEDKDENDKPYARFYYGSEEIEDENGDSIDEYESPDLYDFEYNRHVSFILYLYIFLCELEECGEIIDCWIYDGSQGGYRPKKEIAQKLKKDYDKKITAYKKAA